MCPAGGVVEAETSLALMQQVVSTSVQVQTTLNFEKKLWGKKQFGIGEIFEVLARILIYWFR